MALLTAALIAGVLASAAGVAGAVINSKAQEKTNDTNVRLTNETNAANQLIAAQEREFNAAEAEKDRQFQLEMSNTAVQRRAADLEAAGFNPMLAATDAASVTGGAQASATTARNQAASVENTMPGNALQSLASIAQSAAFMAALGSRAQQYNKPYVRNQMNFDASGALKGMSKTIYSR